MVSLFGGAAAAAAGADVEGALQILQWAASTKPEPSSAEQQLKEAWQKVGAKVSGLQSTAAAAAAAAAAA
jgi:hypothetical protein